jgi:hypothetical protein
MTYIEFISLVKPWIAPATVLVSASAASFFAYTAIKSNRQLTKKSSTMKFIMDRSRDDNFVKSFDVIRRIDNDRNTDIRFYADKKDYLGLIENENKEAEKKKLAIEKGKHDSGVKCLNYLLNQYEYMAVGIKKGIYDEELLKDASRSSTVAAYKITQPFILGIRENLSSPRPTAYTEFEELSKRWE